MVSIAAISTSGSLAGRTTSAPGVARDLTLSFDAKPAYSEWDSIQPGFECENGKVDHSAPTKPPSAAFVRDKSPGNVRHGRYSAKVVLKPGDHATYTCRAEAVAAIKDLNEGEGSESWWGWSWKLPHGWRGTDSWGMLFEFTPTAFYDWPSYGMLNFDAATRNSLRLGLHTGLTPNPGSGSYNAAYEKWVTLLGPHAPRRMIYGKWLDFYMHVVGEAIQAEYSRSGTACTVRRSSASFIRTFRETRRSSACSRTRRCSTTPRTGHPERTANRDLPSREASIEPMRAGKTRTGGTE